MQRVNKDTLQGQENGRFNKEAIPMEHDASASII